MKRLALIAAIGMGFLLQAPHPATAIETSTFGIEPAVRNPDGTPGVSVALDAGKATEVSLRVWNKTERPLALDLRAAPATLDEAGTPRLGGDSGPAEWIRFGDATVTLDGGERRIVTVEVEAPRQLETTEQTAAVVARPRVPGAETPAVLEEVGLVFRMSPADGASLVAAPDAGSVPVGLFAVAALLVAAGVALVARESRRRRRTSVAFAA